MLFRSVSPKNTKTIMPSIRCNRSNSITSSSSSYTTSDITIYSSFASTIFSTKGDGVEVGGSDGDDCSLLKRILFSGSTNPMTKSLPEDDSDLLESSKVDSTSLHTAFSPLYCNLQLVLDVGAPFRFMSTPSQKRFKIVQLTLGLID